MKKALIAIAGALIFSTLFYSQNLGLNMLLFAITAVIAVFTIHKIARRPSMYIIASLYVTSALFVFTVNTILSMITCIIAFIIFSGAISGVKNSIYAQWFNGLYQLIAGAIHQRVVTKSTKEITPKNHNYGFIILTIVVVLVIVLIFALLYGKANPILGSWIAKIDLSFINLSWFITTIMGYLLINNLLSSAEFDVLTVVDRNAPIILETVIITEKKETTLTKQLLFGTVLLIALNVLILLFVVVDITYISGSPLSDAAALSKTVHEGVGALVVSIIIAITIILILFRGDLNFYKKSEKLRLLTYTWIGLNILIIVLTAYKNYLYSSGFGLTYKRIGVFIYLALSITGMITTYFKIARKHNFLFMLQANTRVAFFILIAISSFSWDRVITKQNLAQVTNPDMSYLLTMASSNADLLSAFAKTHPEKDLDTYNINREYNEWASDLISETWQSTTLRGLLNNTNPNTETNDTPEVYTQD